VHIKMDHGRCRIELHLASGRTVSHPLQAVRPRMKQRDPGRASLRRGHLQVVNAPQDLRTSVAQRRSEHPARG